MERGGNGLFNLNLSGKTQSLSERLIILVFRVRGISKHPLMMKVVEGSNILFS